MFDKNLNIIHGDRISGRTQFLFTISKAFNEVGVKLFFLACTGDIDNVHHMTVYDKNNSLSYYDDYRIINTLDEINNYKVIEVVKELSEKRKYNFIIVDDIDYLPKSCLDLLLSLDTIKISTCLSDNCNKLPKDSNFYNINDVSDLLDVTDMVKRIVRDQKINKILK
jgi:thymidine kinase